MPQTQAIRSFRAIVAVTQFVQQHVALLCAEQCSDFECQHVLCRSPLRLTQLALIRREVQAVCRGSHLMGTAARVADSSARVPRWKRLCSVMVLCSPRLHPCPAAPCVARGWLCQAEAPQWRAPADQGQARGPVRVLVHGGDLLNRQHSVALRHSKMASRRRHWSKEEQHLMLGLRWHHYRTRFTQVSSLLI